MSGEDEKTTLETRGEDVKTTLEMSREDHLSQKVSFSLLKHPQNFQKSRRIQLQWLREQRLKLDL